MDDVVLTVKDNYGKEMTRSTENSLIREIKADKTMLEWKDE